MQNQLEIYTDAELQQQREALKGWIHAALRNGGSATLLKQALEMIETELKRRGFKDERI